MGLGFEERIKLARVHRNQAGWRIGEVRGDERVKGACCAIALVLLCTGSHVAGADLANPLCHKEDPATKQMCDDILIGTIDALQGMEQYCPDGNTSYGYIIDTWRRLLSRQPAYKDVPTVLSVRKAIADLGLACTLPNSQR